MPTGLRSAQTNANQYLSRTMHTIGRSLCTKSDIGEASLFAPVTRNLFNWLHTLEKAICKTSVDSRTEACETLRTHFIICTEAYALSQTYANPYLSRTIHTNSCVKTGLKMGPTANSVGYEGLPTESPAQGADDTHLNIMEQASFKLIQSMTTSL